MTKKASVQAEMDAPDIDLQRSAFCSKALFGSIMFLELIHKYSHSAVNTITTS